MLFFRPPCRFFCVGELWPGLGEGQAGILRRELLEAGVTGRGGLEFCLTPKSGGFL